MSPGTDNRPPLFFLSYARSKDADSDLLAEVPRNSEVIAFFRDVVALVRQLHEHLPGDRLGFMDVNVETGRVWESQLLHAVGTCQVFVALLSPPYLKSSEWCAMEWDLFSQRQTETVEGQTRAVDVSAILPVIWTPIPDAPRIVTEVQWFVPSGLPHEYVARYEDEGVLGLLNAYPTVYKPVVWKIARKIDQISRSYRPRPVVRRDTADLRRSFQEGEQ
jgi:hypothetical protein